MSSIQEAYTLPQGPAWETKENPQKYTYMVTEYISPEPRRHILGIVGGNDVSVAAGNLVDLESDLKGINLPNTFCPWRKYQPPAANAKEIVRDNVKIKLEINTTPPAFAGIPDVGVSRYADTHATQERGV